MIVGGPWMRREFGRPLTELGTIRLRIGDLAGAEEAFPAADEHGRDPQPGLALLRLAQGDVPTAGAVNRGGARPPPPRALQGASTARRCWTHRSRSASPRTTCPAPGPRPQSCRESGTPSPPPARRGRHLRPQQAILGRLAVRTATSRPAQADTDNVFRLDGDIRTVAFGGHTVLLQDLKGMHYLARLLAAPDREFHVLDLVADDRRTGPRRGEGDTGPALDAQARAAYKRRLAEIDADIDEATSLGDDERLALATADHDYLVRELARAYGLGGRHRSVGATSERARASVTRALRYAVARIAEHHPALADHLARTLRTGTYCSYVPDARVPARWQL